MTPDRRVVFVLDLPHSDAGFVKAYPAETTERLHDEHGYRGGYTTVKD